MDANYNNVYEGLIPELLEPSPPADDLTDSSIFQTLKAVVHRIVPLNLINPEDEATFTPENCHTLHDIVRYAHEFSMREMFRLTEHEVQGAAKVVDLGSNLPLKIVCWIWAGGSIGVGGERSAPPKWCLCPSRLSGWGSLSGRGRRPPGRSGPPGARTSADAMSPGGGRDRTYAVLSDHYLNLHLRLGHLLFMVEAYITDQVNDNYLTFGAREEGATPEFHEIRARLLEATFNRLELSTHRKGNLIEARLAEYSRNRWPTV